VRSNAVALVDAFNLPDSILCSPFGASDGDVYNRYLQLVKSSPGNYNNTSSFLFPFSFVFVGRTRLIQPLNIQVMLTRHLGGTHW
jgi:hypothetical protein